MKKEDFYVLAAKYFSKEASADELAQLNVLLQQRKYSALFKSISVRWEMAGRTDSLSEFNRESAFYVLTAKIRKHEPSFRWEKEAIHRGGFYTQPMFLRIAASFALIIVLAAGALFLVPALKQKQSSIAWNEKKTVMGEKSIVTLLDGTNITLNADSKLSYPVRFGEDLREVSLEGEAYFEVIHDDAKPFIVHAGGVTTIDRGTKFNIHAFPHEDDIVVSLEEGKVEVSTINDGKRKEDVMLAPAQQWTYSKEHETDKIEPCDVQKAVGWKDNILIFDNEPLSKILVPLERYFGVKFEVADRALARRTIKANFKNESLWTVVKVIEKATGLSYKTDQEHNELKKIVFYEQ